MERKLGIVITALLVLTCTAFAGTAPPKDLPPPPAAKKEETPANTESAAPENKAEAVPEEKTESEKKAEPEKKAETAPASETKAETEKKPAAKPEPEKKPASQPETKPAETPAPKDEKEEEEEEESILFQFDGVPYTQVIRRYAQELGKPLIGDLSIEGTLTFFDSRPYTLSDAFTMLNTILAMKGFILVEKDRYLQLKPISEIPAETRIIRGLEKARNIPPEEIVTVVLPLQYADPEKASKAVVRMVSSFGSISPLKESGSVVITDRMRNIERIRTILGILDEGEPASEGKFLTVTLKNASAGEAADILSKLFGKSKSARRVYNPKLKKYVTISSGGKSDSLQIASDERSNMVIAYGSAAKLALAEEILKKLDVAEARAAGDVKIFTLKNARATELAETIEDTLKTKAKGKGRAGVVADTATNRIIVSGSSDHIATAETLLKELDISPEGATEGFRIIKLEHVRAADVYRSLRALAAGGRSSKRRGSRLSKIAAAYEINTNRLILSGPVEELAETEKLVQQIDAKPKQHETEIHVIKLSSGDAAGVARSVARLYRETHPRKPGTAEPAVVVEPEVTSNALIVSATPAQWPDVEKLIAKLQPEEEGMKAPAMRLVPLKHAKAADLADALQRASRYRHYGEAGWLPVSIVAAAEKTLLLTGSRADLDELSSLIDSLDTAPRPLEVRTFEVKTGTASSLARSLQGLLTKDEPAYSRWRKRTSGTGKGPKIMADDTTNRLMIAAEPEQWPRIEQLVETLQKGISDAKDTTTRLVQLKHADARTLATVLQTSSRHRHYGEEGWNPVSVVAASEKALIITAAKSDVDELSSLVESLDKEPEPVEIRTFTITTGRASAAAAALQALLQKEPAGRYSRSRTPAKAGEPRITADDSTNRLIIAAAPAQWPRIEAMVKKLKEGVEESRAPAMKLVMLEHAKASKLAGVLQQAARYRHYGQQGWMPVSIVATSEQSLLITASRADIEELSALVASLDKEPEPMEIRTFTIKTGRASAAAAALQALLQKEPAGRYSRSRTPAKAGEPRITADDSTNRLIIAAAPAQWPRLETMVEKLKEGVEESRAPAMKLVKLKHAAASNIAESLQQAARFRHHGEEGWVPASIVASSEKSLLITASRADIEELSSMIEALDVKKDPLEIRTYKITAGKAADVARSLEGLFAKESKAPAWSRYSRGKADKPASPKFESDTATNQIIVAATPDEFPAIEKLIEKLQAKSELAVQTKTFTLKFVEAREMVEMLEEVTGSEGGRSRYWWRRSSGGEENRLRIASLPSANGVVVQGPAEQVQMVEELIRTFDTDKEAARIVLRHVRLENANAETLASSVNNVLEAAGGGRSYRGRRTSSYKRLLSDLQGEKDLDQVSIIAEQNSNSLLVRGPSTAVESIVTLIGDLDKQSISDEVQVRIFPLKNSDAGQLADDLEDMFNALLRQSRYSRSGSRKTSPFSVAANKRTNSLIVSTTPANFQVVEKMLADLDGEEKSRREVEYVFLENADAFDVYLQLDELFTDRPWGERPSVTTDSEANALTMIGTESDLKLMKEVVTKLDAQAAKSSVRVRVITLSDVSAERMANMIQRLYAPRTDKKIIVTDNPEEGAATEPADKKKAAPAVSPATSSPSAAPAAETGTEKKEEKESAPSPITIAVDKKANALLLSGPRRELEEIEALVSELSYSASPEAEFRTFEVENADPTQVAETLEEIFNPKVERVRGKLVKARPKITAVAIERLRRIIVRGKPLDLEMVRPLVEQLDKGMDVSCAVKVFTLKNATASAVAANLENILAGAAGTKKATSRRSPVGRRIERMRRVLVHEAGEGKPVEIAGEVTVDANDETNSIVASAPAEVMALIGSLIRELDQSAAEAATPVVRFYRLENAEVPDAVADLKELFSETARTKKTRAAAFEPPVVITGDESGGVVIVSASQQKQELISEVVKQIDSIRAAEQFAVKIYTLKNAEAIYAARALSQSFSDATVKGKRVRTGESGLRISADPSSNALIVRARTEDHEKIAALVEKLDVSRTADASVRMIPLSSADPVPLARVLTNLFVTGKRDTVAIEANTSAQALMVRADDETFDKIRAMVEQLDTGASGKERTRSLIKLTHAEASPVALALQRSFAPAPGTRTGPEELVEVVAEPGSNSLVVTASAENLKKVTALVAELDSEEISGVKTKFMVLKNARAADIAGILSKIAESTAAPAYGRRRTAATRSVAISPEATSNAVVVSGPAAKVAEMMQMAGDLDQAATVSSTGVYIIPLEKGDAESVANMLSTLHYQQLQAARREGTSMEAMAVSADPRANAVVVATTKQMYERVKTWIAQLEEMKPQRDSIRIITVESAAPEDVKRAIEQMFDQGEPGTRGRRGRAGGGRSGKGQVDVSVIEKPRGVIISADERDFEAIRELVKGLEAAAEKGKRLRKIFKLANVTNQRVVQALARLYPVRRGVDEDDQVTITAVSGTRAVIVVAPRKEMDEIEHLVQQLDMKEISPKLEFRVFRLENADPAEILPTLRSMLLQLRQAYGDTAFDVRADTRTKSIIVTARGDYFEKIEPLIKTLDEKPEYATADMAVIRLERADAEALADVIKEMLSVRGDRQMTPEARTLQEQLRLLRVRGGLKKKLPDLDLSKPIKIIPDPAEPQGSNSLVIISTAENIAALREVVAILDTVPVAEGVAVKIIHLKNADADSVADILDDIFDEGKKLAGKPDSSVEEKAEPESMAGKALASEISIAYDDRTNAVIMAGATVVIALAETLVKDLDREQDKLLTDVKLFRLKHADAERLAPILISVFEEAEDDPELTGLRTHVTRLRTHLANPDGNKKPAAGDGEKTTRRPRPRQPLVIEADATTNILIVSARSDLMPLIADVIDKMDVAGAGSLRTVRIIPLENADVTRVGQMIEELYAGPNRQLIREEDRPTITADTRTNSLVVSASDKTFTVLSTVVESLDRKTPVELRDLRLLTLENAEATVIAPTLQEMMDARVERQESLGVADAAALRVVITADPRSNSLIVGGSPESYQIIRDLARKLDTASPALAGQVQIYPVVEGTASSIARTLSSFFDDRYRAARTRDVERRRPVIIADVRTNSLIVSAVKDDTKVLQGLLKKLDVKLAHPSVRLEVICLKHNDSGTVSQTLEEIFSARLESMTPRGEEPEPQDRVDITADPLSNALIVSASKENLDLLRGLLEKVDIEPPDETGIVKMYRLENSDASRIAEMLDNLVSQGFYKPGLVTAAGNDAIRAREKVSITVDTRTNVIIVSASKENFAIIDEIIRTVDKTEDFGTFGDVRIFILKHANATKLGPTLQEFFDEKLQAEQSTGASQRTLPVVIVPDARTNAILVAGSRESFNDVSSMIDRLDTATAVPETTFDIFTLRHATADKLRATIQSLFDQRTTRDPDQPNVTVLSDPRENSLIVGAAKEDIEIVRSLIQKLDTAQKGDDKTIKVFPLSKANAAEVADTVERLYESEGGEPGGISVSTDERMNALVVSGGAADLDRVSRIVKQLDRKEVTSVTEIKVVPLESADAEELAALLTDVLNRKPEALPGENPNRQTLLRFTNLNTDGRKKISDALQQGLLINPDKRTNSLVVSAPMEYMPMLEEMITALDRTSPREAEIRIFRLKNADATGMADVLQQLFRTEDATGANRNAPEIMYTMNGKSADGAKPEQPAKKPGEKDVSAATGSADQTTLNITVDMRTNSLLIGGTPRQLEMAAEVINALDSCPAQERVTRVYHPRTTNAAQMVATIREFLDQERDRILQTLGEDRVGAAQRLLDREVAVVAEEETNTVMISASPRYLDTLASMLEELDQEPPQVLVQVLLAEVDLNDDTTLGIDWSWQVGSESTVGTDFNISAGIVAGNPAGFNVSVTGGDLSFFLRALQQQNRLQVLSRPQLLAVENVTSTLNIGERVPLITNSRVTDENTTINTISYEDVGIQLEVTPHIGSDGTIRMELNPEVSSVGTSTTAISENAEAPFINNRSANTTVTCYNGQTIILGGLISTRDSYRENKVPLLGDIPVLGLLFRSTTREERRNELLIFVTPTIVRNADTARRILERQVKGNETLTGTRIDHSFKDRLLKTIRGKGMQEAIRQPSESLPENPAELRRQTLEKTLKNLELVPVVPDEETPPHDRAIESEVD